MATIAGKITGHQDTPFVPVQFVYDIPDGADPELHALLLVLNDEFEFDADEQADVVMAALRQAKKTKEAVGFALRDDSDDDDDTVREFTVWYMDPKFGELVPNFGVGPDDGDSMTENRWVEVGLYKPDEALRKRLDGFSKEQLIEILLRTHAASYISFPPSLNG